MFLGTAAGGFSEACHPGSVSASLWTPSWGGPCLLWGTRSHPHRSVHTNTETLAGKATPLRGHPAGQAAEGAEAGPHHEPRGADPCSQPPASLCPSGKLAARPPRNTGLHAQPCTHALAGSCMAHTYTQPHTHTASHLETRGHTADTDGPGRTSTARTFSCAELREHTYCKATGVPPDPDVQAK